MSVSREAITAAAEAIHAQRCRHGQWADGRTCHRVSEMETYWATAALEAAEPHMCGRLVGYVPVSIGAVRDAYTAHTTVARDREATEAEVRKLARYVLGEVRVAR
jgi:hypothetical protein